MRVRIKNISSFFFEYLEYDAAGNTKKESRLCFADARNILISDSYILR